MANSTNGPVQVDNSEKTGPINDIINSPSPENPEKYASTWGFPLKDLYKLSTTFLKDHEGKAFHLSYEDKISLVAYTQQVSHGKFNPENLPPLGYFDVIGRDRRQAWMSLGDLDKDISMMKFIQLLDSKVPLFRPYIEAHKRDLEEKERLKRLAEEEKRREEEEEQERLRLEEQIRKDEEERQRQLEQKRLIQEALNRQTYHQFKAYAEQQFPENPEQQGVLIRQLQEQHYHQYMQQILNQQLKPQKDIDMADTNETTKEVSAATEQEPEKEKSAVESSGEETGDDDNQELPAIPTASMWTRKDIREFKDCIRKEGGDGIIKVGHGETVTVRVPTHEDGTCLFWEFATDSYDIGFGVYFEWTKNPGNQVSVHISESEDEDEEEEELDKPNGNDIEKGEVVPHPDAPPVSVIIPVYRRDCHEEVYAGSHVYPGQGVYLLKFDNSYSLWRSKTLYYRVYYTR